MIGCKELVLLKLVKINCRSIFYSLEEISRRGVFEYLVISVYFKGIVEKFMFYDGFL